MRWFERAAMIVARGRRWSAVDAAMIQLVRLVLADGWSATAAADELRERVPNDTVLRRVRSRVSAGLADRVSHVGQRALATLDLALAPVTVDGEIARLGPLAAEVVAP